MARIFECIRIFVEVLHSNTLTNECPNIFLQTNLTQRMSKYIRKRKIYTNVRIYIRDEYIRIFEYIRHTLTQILNSSGT